MTIYSIGPIDDARDHGRGWRARLSTWCLKRGIQHSDPTTHPLNSVASAKRRKKLTRQQRSSEMALIRREDLAALRQADVAVFHLQPAVHKCGSWEECFICIAEMKTLIIVCPCNKRPLWLLGAAHNQPNVHFMGDMTAARQLLSAMLRKSLRKMQTKVA
jgi:hypothetical protein